MLSHESSPALAAVHLALVDAHDEARSLIDLCVQSVEDSGCTDRLIDVVLSAATARDIIETWIARPVRAERYVCVLALGRCAMILVDGAKETTGNTSQLYTDSANTMLRAIKALNLV